MTKVRALLIALVGTLCVLSSGVARAQRRPNDYVTPPQFEPGKPNTPPELTDVGVDEGLDAKLPLDATFKDHTGKTVKLGDYVDGRRPTLLVFAYHTSPTICSLIQTSVAQAMKGVDWTAGQDYQAITISIDPKDGPEQAATKRQELLAQYGRPVDDKGWAFLTTTDDETIRSVTKNAGWRYYYDERQKQYAHPSAIVLLKPNGRIARYLYGLDFSPKDLRLGLLEASEYKSISTIDRVVLYCYRFDGHQRRYTIVATRVMQLGGGATALVLAIVLARFWLKERKKPKGPTPDGGAPPKAAKADKTPADPSVVTLRVRTNP